MTVATWEPGKLYINGDLARPRRQEAAGPASLADGDFETATVGTVLTPRWSVANDSAFTGTKSIKFQGGTSDTGEYILPDRIACKPGESVTASCMFNQGAASKNNAGGAVRIYWFGAGGAQVGLIEGNIIKSGGGGYAKTAATAVAPANATHFGVGVNGFHNGSGQPMWADHFVINYTPSAPVLNPLIYKAVQADPGTSAGTEPEWPTTLGVTVVDGGVTWEAIGTGYIVWRAEPNMRSGATEPTWPVTEGESVSDGTIVWEARTTRVTDPKCPNSKVVAILASKVFAADGDIIRFSATANPLDWSTPRDAGYLPSGLQQANSNDMAVLQPYRSNLCAWNASSFQMWQVDPDPEQMAILDQMDGVGSTWQHAAQAVGNDLLFLSQQGVRSVGIAIGAENLAAGDVGAPVDSLVLSTLAGVSHARACSTYFPGAGQYWLTFPSVPPLPPGPSISGSAPDGVVGFPYDGFDYTFSGEGPLSVTFTGALPPGLSFTATGISAGSLSEAGSYSFRVEVSDKYGRRAQLDEVVDVLGSALACSAAASYTGGEAFPTTFDVWLGAGVGTVSLQYATAANPDKFEVWLDGVKVLDTGYHGDVSYQAALDANLAGRGLPAETITQRPGSDYEPTDQWNNGNSETASFVKTTGSTVAQVRVYAPMSGTAWKLSLGCPDGVIP